MAADVKVREIRLLEAYSQRYQGFMESSIAMSYRFRAIITQKDDEARDYTRKISDHVNIIEQKLTHAKNDLEASARRGGGMDGKELELRAQKVERWKKLFEKTAFEGKDINEVWKEYQSSDFATLSSYASTGETSELLAKYDARKKAKTLNG
jgi:hypothetical protein